ncbi:hypothetical protein ACQ5SO_20765 [Rhodovulum sp. DZ06]|uniref:hypothetical protein n=1 Tax=Rhodovulum sp. DZ06 TaxID=3425126 RepID=UPI003D3462D4
MIRSILSGASLLALNAGGAAAATVFFNPPDNANAVEATASVAATAFSIAPGATVAAAALPVLAADGAFDAFWDGAAAYWIFADDAGGPGAVLASGAGVQATAVDLGITPGFQNNVFALSFNLAAPFTAAPGASYWFGLHLAGEYDRGGLYWMTSAAPTGVQTAAGGAFDAWAPGLGAGLALELLDSPIAPPSADVPPPAAAPLMLLGLAGLGVASRRRPG